MEPVEVVFEIEKETKNSIRFQEITPDGEVPKIQTLYVKKSVFGKNEVPKTLKVTISFT